MHKAFARCLAFALLALPIVFLQGCSERSPAQAQAPRERPPHLVEIAPVSSDSLGFTSTHNGTLKVRRTARIFTQEAGRIVTLPYYEGDQVEEGEVVATLDDALLQAELGKANALRAQAELNLRRIDDLSRRKLASADELARARTELAVAEAEEQLLLTRLGYMTLRAPFAGVVSERLAEPGDVVASNTQLLTLTDPASLMIEVAVSELLLPYLHSEDPVEVRIDALAGQDYPGRIERIHPTLDPRSRSGMIEIKLTEPPSQARAGQFARVRLETRADARRIIPFRALQRDRSGEYVFRLDAEGKARYTPVRSGLRLADKVEILEGLETGDQVIIRGFLNLRDEQTVTVVNESGDST